MASFMARPGLGGASVRRRAVRAGTRQAANEFAACYVKPAEAGCATTTGFSRFRIGQAVNSFMAGIHGRVRSRRRGRTQARGSRVHAAAEAGCATITGFSRFRIGQAVNSFMADICATPHREWDEVNAGVAHNQTA